MLYEHVEAARRVACAQPVLSGSKWLTASCQDQGQTRVQQHRQRGCSAFGKQFCPNRLRETETIWPSVLPSDIDSSVRNAVSLVTSGIQSRRTAWASLGGLDPDAERARVQEEEEVPIP